MVVEENLRLRLAQTVLKPDQWLIRISRQEKSEGRFPSVEEEVRLDTCFAGVPKSTFVALDGDMEDAVERARDLCEELSDAGFSPVILRSGDEAFKVHVWIRTDNENLSGIVGARGKALGFDWRRLSPIRPPFTRHYRGAQMSPLDLTLEQVTEALTTPVDLSSIDDDWFNQQIKTDKPEPKKIVILKNYVKNSTPQIEPTINKIVEKKTIELIKNGTLDEKTQAAFKKSDGSVDRSRVLLKVSLGCRRNGLSWEDFESLSRDPDLKGFAHVWALPKDARKRAVKRAWEASEALHEEHLNQREKSRQNAALLQKSALSVITGRGRENRLLVLATVIEMAQALGSNRVRIDIRRIVESCHSHRSTVDKSLKWLCQTGWMKRLEVGEGRKASLYEIPQVSSPVNPSYNSSNSLSSYNRLEGGRVRIVPRMDLKIPRRAAFLGRWCGRQGLGKTAGFITEALSLLGASSKAGLARALDRKTIAPKAFQRLAEAGLVERVGKLWRTPDDLLERLSRYEEGLGLNHLTKAMRRLHEIERWRYLYGDPLPYQVTPERYLWAKRKAA